MIATVGGAAACAALPACAALGGAGGAAALAGGAGGLVAGGPAGLVGGAGQAAAGAVFSALGATVTQAAGAALGQVAAAVAGSPTETLRQPWFAAALGPMSAVAVALATPLLLAASIAAVLRQDVGRLARVWLLSLPLAATLSAAVLPLTWLASATTDELASAVAPAHLQVAQALGSVVPTAAAVGNGALAAVLAGLVLAGAVALWLELVLRSAAIEVVVLFLPLCLAALLWPATAGVARRAAEVLAALLLSKFVVAAVLALGLAATAAEGRGGAGELTGLAILLLAAFAPVALLRLVPVVEASAIAHLEGRARQPLRSATGAVTTGRQLAGRPSGLDGPLEQQVVPPSPSPGGGSDEADRVGLVQGREAPGFGDWSALGTDREGSG